MDTDKRQKHPLISALKAHAWSRRAWQNFVRRNRKRQLYVDLDIDISQLCDEVNDIVI